ncbi:MAG: T9SS type A sorting domain-containing protein [Flavobacteriales bacterium]|nr:T9SS type A sorting domain-containing protein [Flavobacteriales bacterium]
MPFSNHFILHGPSTVRLGEVRLLDLTGREVLRMPYTGTGMVVDASALPAGPYILRLADEHGRLVHQRVIKQ